MQEGQRLAIGMDIGGTKIEASLIDGTGQILETLREPALPDNEGMLARIIMMANELAEGHKIEGAGFSIPGSLDPRTGILRNAPNSPAINCTALGEDLARHLPFTLAFENDANCLVKSEHRFGAAKGYRHVVGIILGTGVGGGVILDNKLLSGAQGIAPEPGHLPLDINGRLCGCGNLGCAEAYLSGPSVLRRYHDAGGSAEVKDTKALFEREGDTIATQIIEETGRLYARYMSVLVSLFDPEVFVLGGGLSLQPMFTQLGDEIGRLCFGTDEAPPVVHATGGDASGKLGAAALIFDRHL